MLLNTSPISISLLEFIRTGMYGSVYLGQHRDELESALGFPDCWSSDRSVQKANIWKYGDIEFHFNNHYLWLIHMDSFEIPQGGVNIDLDPWIIHYLLDREIFESELQNEGILFTRHPNQSDLCDTDVKTQGNVSCRFGIDINQDRELSGLIMMSSLITL